ncbi:MAG: hypothetical protein DBX45_00125 [Oscillospiraceae bacterium]|nr:MAG: hypothetical protein DBX45_00125 [Oscillospiraceae bacterium]
MLPPYEIKAKEFTHVLRGYAVEEVDEYCAFALDKYTELYRENDALEQKIASLEAELAHFREDEESIRSALVDAKRASTRIVEEATERSKVILHSAKLNCDRILSEFRSAVSEERDELLLLRAMVKKFKDDLFSAYKTHIEYIERIAPELDSLDESEFSDEAVLRLAVESIKGSIREDESTADGDIPLPTDDAASDAAEEAAQNDSDTAESEATETAGTDELTGQTDSAAEGDVQNADGAAYAAENGGAADESNGDAADGAALDAVDDEQIDSAGGADDIPTDGDAPDDMDADIAEDGADSSGPASNNASVGTETSIPVMNADSGTAGVQMSLFSDEDELVLERSELGGFDAEMPDENDEDDDFLAFPEELGSAPDNSTGDELNSLIDDIRGESDD